jgi:ATP-dependent DNA ligase
MILLIRNEGIKLNLELVNEIYNKSGKRASFDIVDTETGEIIKPKFDRYTMIEDYEEADVLPIEPMLAKEYLNDKELDKMLDSEDYVAEEKLDGTRQTMHIGKECSRLFSRNKSKDTEWYVENSDKVPHLREVALPEWEKTIIDGEMRIDGREFEDVSGTLNCVWNEAIARQIDLGFITLHSFDIIYYKGVYVAKMPLWKRKKLLDKVVKAINSPYVVAEEWTYDNVTRTITDKMVRDFFLGTLSREAYPHLYRTIENNITFGEADFWEYEDCAPLDFDVEIDKRTWYEYVIYNGGEGIMLKDKNGTYRHARGREYTKWKKFITRECIVMGFSEPTKEYQGKFPNDSWEYWVTLNDNVCTTDYKNRSAKELLQEKDIKTGKQLFIPVNKFYYNDWVGNMRFGVIVTPEEVTAWEKINKTKAVTEEIYGNLVLEVGECAGYDEELREQMSINSINYVGTVVEILANEIFKKTGKLRHPRFLRFRNDKAPEQCIWRDHINQ